MEKIFTTKRLAVVITSLFLTLFATVGLSASRVHAEAKDNLCQGANLSLSGNDDCNAEGSGDSLNNTIEQVVNIFSVIVGVVAVIMIIIGGFKYITSGGDSGKVGSAKSTIIYAIVGLIIVALAQVIVKFVISRTAASN